MRIRSGRVRMGAGEPPSRLEAWDPAARARLVRVARDAASEMLRYAAQVGLTRVVSALPKPPFSFQIWLVSH